MAILLGFAAIVAAGPGNAAGPADGFTCGINVRNYLAYPDFEEWPYYRGDLANPTGDELRRFKALGFDFVRLAVEVGPWMVAPAGIRQALGERLADFIQRAHAAGLRTMVNMFPRPDSADWQPEDLLKSKDGAAFRTYRALLGEVALVLSDLGRFRPALELMNEPQAACRRTIGLDWAELQPLLYGDVRAVAKDLTIVVTGGCWSRIAGLAAVNMAAFDSNTLVDVHYYEPFSFTHQGAWWTVPELHHAAGLAFPPGTTDLKQVETAVGKMLDTRHKGPAQERRELMRQTMRNARRYKKENFDEAAIRAEMAELRDWAVRNGVPPGRILIGEFGVLRSWPESGLVDDGSRARWLRTVRSAAEAHGFGWALWSYEGVFGLINDETAKSLDSSMLDAIGLPR